MALVIWQFSWSSTHYISLSWVSGILHPTTAKLKILRNVKKPDIQADLEIYNFPQNGYTRTKQWDTSLQYDTKIYKPNKYISNKNTQMCNNLGSLY
jgi:hypothetical protein